MTRALFFFFVIVLAFIPGGLFISVFLLALYYIVPLFLENNSRKEEEAFELTIPFKVTGIATSGANMKSYSDDTLEEMK